MKSDKLKMDRLSLKSSKLLIVLIVVLVVSNAITLLWVNKSNKETIDNYQNPYPLIDIARNFVDKKDFIVNIQPLRNYLYDLVEESLPNKVSIYFEVLNTGANISINQDSRFWPASLSKVPAAMVVLKKVELGEWKLTNELVLFEEDKDSRYGDLYKKPVGTRFTVEELIKEMIIHSDNTAIKMFIRNLSADEFEKIIDNLGLEDLYNEDYDISAKEYSRIFRALYNSNFLEPYYSQLILSWLSETPFNNYLGSGVKEGTIFAHKIGEQVEQKTYLDSGIVYVPNRAYLITVLIKVEEDQNQDSVKKTAEQIMQNISKKAYEYITTV